MSTVVTIAERPAPGAPRPYRFPDFERLRLANGMGLIVAPVRKLPVATILLVADAGAATEEGHPAGVANLMAKSLLEGTTRRTGIELLEQFELLGATVEAGADWDSVTVAMSALSSNLAEAFALFAEVLREPSFPERELERVRAERLADILQLRSEPRGLADEKFESLLYAAGSRYVLPQGGSAETVSAIGAPEVRAFHEQRFRPGGMTLIVVGDVSVEDARAMAERTLGDWTGAAPPAVRADDRQASETRAVHVIARPDAPQSELRVGHVGLSRSHPDYFPVLVMNSVLGGLFSSRINLNLREVHGYTYGAFSSYDWRRSAGPFVVSSAVKSDVTAAATREVLGEIDRIRQAAITADELSLATSYLDGVFPIRFETTSAIARALGALVVYGLPENYFDRYRERVRGVTADDVLNAARSHLHPDALQIVIVGEPAAIGAGMEELGPVTVHAG